MTELEGESVKGMEKNSIKVISVYMAEGSKRPDEKLNESIGEDDIGKIVIGGDFNIRMGELGSRSADEGGAERYSKDKIVGNGGKNLSDWIKEKGWYILNGATEGDWNGEYTYAGARGSSVIDYVIVNEEMRNRIRKFCIGERVDSDHLPMEIEMEEEEEEGQVEDQGEQREDTKEEEVERIIWDEESRKLYEEKTEELSRLEDDKGRTPASVEEMWETIKRIITGAMVRRKIKRRKRRELGHRDWWDRSCSRKKRGLKRMYRRWKKGKVEKEKFLEEKKKFKELIEKKQKDKRKEEEEDLRKLKKETDIWKYINRTRNKRENTENKIKKEVWRQHFMDLLEGKEEDGVTEGGKQREEMGQEKMLEEEEIMTAVRKMKLKKAVGVDGIPMEAWRYAGVGLRRKFVDLLMLIWKCGSLPRDWRKSIVVPLYKRGDKESVGNYRGISLLCSAYKIYAEIIRKRLEKEVEEKNMVPESQAGFRRGRSTIDNIFVLNHLIQKAKRKGEKENRVYMLFADLKAAFDKVDRGRLWESMRGKGMTEHLIRRIERIYEETEVTVRTQQGYTNSFKTTKGVRQGCVLSPLLFNLYIADIDKIMKDRNIGGVKIGKIRIWNLAYADDIVLLANNRDAMQDMMSVFRRFLKDIKLELSADKTKMIVVNRKRKERKEKWQWGGKEIEEVQEFKYLGFVLSNKGNYKEHMKELGGKGKRAARKIWGLGEKICRNDFRRRWVLFKYLVQSVMAFGVEIWGWEERENLEKIMMDYTRWIFGLEFCTPRYVIARELMMDKLRVGWGIRARRYEVKIKEGRAGKIAKECWIEKETYDWDDKYGKERESYYNRNGWGVEAKEIKEGGDNDFELKLINRERDNQRQWEESKILSAKYNSRYKDIGTMYDLPGYLRRESIIDTSRGEEVRALIKLRCGNLEKANKYWLEDYERKCVFCEGGMDCLDHFVRECEKTKEWFRIIGEDVNGIIEILCKGESHRTKDRVVLKLWKEREKELKKRRILKEKEYVEKGS